VQAESPRARSASFSRYSGQFFKPLERFVQIEASSGIVLLTATALALAWANSPWSAAYETLWRAPLSLGPGGVWETTPRQLVNDGLMSLFFLLVGLEIRHELHAGHLGDLRRALTPLMAAMGGIITPALIYLAIASPAELRRGWAIPTATDIAFAIGVLTLLGKRVPAPARVLLLALAVIDDVAAVIFIAVFYARAIAWEGLLLAAAGVGVVLLFQRLAIVSAFAYVLPGVLVWLGLQHAGVHPTLSGVVLGLLTPTKPLTAGKPSSAVTLVQRSLHPWVAFGIMPLFAFANAGIPLEVLSPASQSAKTLTWAIIVALVIGKPLGITAFTWVITRGRLGAMSEELTLRGLVLVGSLGGIGFTMSLFLNNLAFDDPALAIAGKSAVLLGSAVAAIGGFLLGRLVLFPGHYPRADEQRRS
jgi:NhaA family Na+:H+ antiporter